MPCFTALLDKPVISVHRADDCEHDHRTAVLPPVSDTFRRELTFVCVRVLCDVLPSHRICVCISFHSKRAAIDAAVEIRKTYSMYASCDANHLSLEAVSLALDHNININVRANFHSPSIEQPERAGTMPARETFSPTRQPLIPHLTASIPGCNPGVHARGRAPGLDSGPFSNSTLKDSGQSFSLQNSPHIHTRHILMPLVVGVASHIFGSYNRDR